MSRDHKTWADVAHSLVENDGFKIGLVFFLMFAGIALIAWADGCGRHQQTQAVAQ